MVLVLFATKRKLVTIIVRSSARVGVVVVLDIAAVDASSSSVDASSSSVDASSSSVDASSSSSSWMLSCSCWCVDVAADVSSSMLERLWSVVGVGAVLRPVQPGVGKGVGVDTAGGAAGVETVVVHFTRAREYSCLNTRTSTSGPFSKREYSCIGLHVLLSILNYLSLRLPVLLLSSVDVALLLCRLVIVVDGYHLAVVDGRRSVVVVVIAASSKGVGRCHRRLAGAGIAPLFGIDLAMVDWRRSVVVVASLSSPTLTCCCWWWYVTSARGLAQPAGQSAFAKLAITGRGKLGVICELLTLHHELLIINQPYHHDYDLGMRLDDDNGWPAIRQQQTPAGTPSTVGRPRPRRHYGESAMARQVEHDNDDEDDNGPRRQWPTMTTAYDSNGLRRQRPTTVVRDDTDNDNGSSGDTATMPVCDGDRVQ
ncbi:hypothetical protein EDB89DRAFT_1907723 [Lactarius sanguifluus]|nr:hypothetical protein EDB89DRAFT_1907723 [Lactarius sanguifluus]